MTAVLRTFPRAIAPLALVLAAALALAPAAFAQSEGREFVRLKQPVPVETGKKVEVIEFFSYGCPHCADLEPHLQAWLKRLPADVQVRRVPVAFQPAWENLARVYYTLELMGEDTKLTPDVFAALHGGNRTNLANDARFFDWAASKGLDRKKVEDTYKSFGIAGKLGRAKQLAQTYNIQSVPTLIVDGKFLVTSSSAGGHERVPSVLDAAIATARAERPK